jgi:hypothetical protein|tara:strand:- start:255 stop:455 length:201 start_codon:yes stop_codon:yes gene_type:complete
MTKKFKYDGKSRPANDLYTENFKRIFSKGVVNTETSVKDLKKVLKDIDQDYDAAEDLKKIEERNGF